MVSCGGSQTQFEMPTAKFETKVLQPESKTYNMTFPATTCGINEIKVYPQVEGLVTKKNYTPGTIVQKGQTLFVIDPTEYQLNVQSAEANLMVAKANLETTRLQYESNQKLYEKHIISDYVLNTSLNDYNSAQASVSQAQAQLNIARTNLGYCTVTSPVTGFIAGNEYNVGDMVSRAMPVCTVSDISKVKANFSITETQLLSLVMEYHLTTGKNGMEGPNGSLIGDVMPKVKLKLKDGSIYQHDGNLTVIGALVSQTTGTASCEAEFPNPDGVLRSGLSANIIIPFTLDSVLSVPQTAAVRLQDQMMFYRVKQDGTVEGIICKEVYPSNDGMEYYILEGLNAGDEIVTNGAGKLSNGAKIR
jgi:membrane fusion protein (multidrug efflux system)